MWFPELSVLNLWPFKSKVATVEKETSKLWTESSRSLSKIFLPLGKYVGKEFK